MQKLISGKDGHPRVPRIKSEKGELLRSVQNCTIYRFQKNSLMIQYCEREVTEQLLFLNVTKHDYLMNLKKKHFPHFYYLL